MSRGCNLLYKNLVGRTRVVRIMINFVFARGHPRSLPPLITVPSYRPLLLDYRMRTNLGLESIVLPPRKTMKGPFCHPEGGNKARRSLSASSSFETSTSDPTTNYYKYWSTGHSPLRSYLVSARSYNIVKTTMRHGRRLKVK